MLNIGLKSNLIFEELSGTVKETDQYYIVRILDNPSYYFGNYLLVKGKVSSDKLEELESDFNKYVGKPPIINHYTFKWHIEPSEKHHISRFIEKGYQFNENVALVATKKDIIKPSELNNDITIVKFSTMKHWQDWFDLELHVRDNRFAEIGFKTFLKGKMKVYQTLINSGHGNWYGAYIDNRLVSGMGVFLDKDSGVFKRVVTIPEHRNKNICKTMIYRISLERFGQVGKLIMVADEHYHTAKLFESLGFKTRERFATLCWWE